jgi:site-specific recombinase XerD
MLVAVMSDEPQFDRLGRRRSPATLSSFRSGRKPGNAGKTYPAAVYEPAEILRLLGSMTGSAPATLRARALYAFIWRTGLRVAEVGRVREMDLNESTGYVRVRGSGAIKDRDVFVFGSRDAEDWAWRQLRPWIAVRADRGVVRSAPLFCIVQGGTRGDAWSSGAMRVSLKASAKAAGLHGAFGLRGLRNSLAAELYRGNVSVARIKEQFGIATMSSTQSYLEKIGVTQVLDDPREFRPTWRDEMED